MAHIWFSDDAGAWRVFPLADSAVDISAAPPRTLDGDSADGITVVRANAGESQVWVLLAGRAREVRVNGLVPVAGLRVLRDRDEIRVDGAVPVYFSTETLAHAEEFADAGRAIFCGRCRQALQSGDMAVRCPQCGLWYHQTEKLPCWTYTPTCGFCPQGTELGGDYAWVPEA